MNGIKKNTYDALAEEFIGSRDLRKIKSFPLLISNGEYIDEQDKEYLVHEAVLFDELNLELFKNEKGIKLGNIKDLIGFDSSRFGKVVILKDDHPMAYVDRTNFVH